MLKDHDVEFSLRHVLKVIVELAVNANAILTNIFVFGYSEFQHLRFLWDRYHETSYRVGVDADLRLPDGNEIRKWGLITCIRVKCKAFERLLVSTRTLLEGQH